MTHALMPADLVARIKARAADPARRSGMSGVAANAVGIDALLGSMPPIRDARVRAQVEGLRGMLANFGIKLGGDGDGGPFAMVGPSPGFGGGFVSLGGAPAAPAAAPRPCSEAQLQAAEAALGFALPPALRQAYAEIADGGFGPGDGLYGLAQLTAKYREMTAEPVGPQGQAWPAALLPVNGLDWDLVAIDRDSGGLVYWDVEALADLDRRMKAIATGAPPSGPRRKASATGSPPGWKRPPTRSSAWTGRRTCAPGAAERSLGFHPGCARQGVEGSRRAKPRLARIAANSRLAASRLEAAVEFD